MKRANGAGSIRWNPERGRYEVRITHAGERRKVSAKTQSEAWAKADALRHGPLPTDPTVEQWLDEWMRQVKHSDLSPVTIDGYDYIVDGYLKPNVGGFRLSELKPRHVEAMLQTCRSAPTRSGQLTSAHTVRRMKQVLGRALTIAEREELVPRNVARLVDGPRVDSKRERTLTPDQYRMLVSALDDHVTGRGSTQVHESTALLCVFLASTGLRRGEALGLEWRDLDLDAGTLLVRQAKKRDSRTGRDFLAKPKTLGAHRTVHMPAVVVNQLRKLDHTQRFVFGMRLDSATRAVPRHTERVIGEAFSPHELRHSAASLMIAAGVPLKTISETLGHTSISITADVYGHLMADARAETAAAFDRMAMTNDD